MVLCHEDVIARVCTRVLDGPGDTPAANPRLFLLQLLDRMREAQDRDASRDALSDASGDTSSDASNARPNSPFRRHPFQPPVPFDASAADVMACRERRAGLRSVCRIAYAALALVECEAWKAFG